MGIFSKFVAKLKGQSTADPLDWKVLEEELLAADLGPKLTAEILKSAQSLKGDDALSSLKEIHIFLRSLEFYRVKIQLE